MLSPLYKKHSNFISATASFRKTDWNKHCTAQLKHFLCPAQTHWTTELHDQHTVLRKSAASREQGNLRVWDLQGHLLSCHYFSFTRVWGDTLGVVTVWQFMPTLNCAVVLLWLAAYRDKPVYAFPLKWSCKLQIHFYAGCITYFSKEEHGFITWQICSTFSAARRSHLNKSFHQIFLGNWWWIQIWGTTKRWVVESVWMFTSWSKSVAFRNYIKPPSHFFQLLMQHTCYKQFA